MFVDTCLLPIPHWQMSVPSPSNFQFLWGFLSGQTVCPQVKWELQDSDGSLLGSTWTPPSPDWRCLRRRNRPGRHSETEIRLSVEARSVQSNCPHSLRLSPWTAIEVGLQIIFTEPETDRLFIHLRQWRDKEQIHLLQLTVTLAAKGSQVLGMLSTGKAPVE